MKVKVIRYGKIHCHAGCDDCDFNDAIGSGRTAKQVQSAVWHHVAKTGHSAWIETGKHTRYEAGSVPTTGAADKG